MNENLILGGAAAGYKFEFRPDGVYFTVYDARLFELSDMRQILRDCSVMDYDVGVLSRVMREASGRAQKIAQAVSISEEVLKSIGGHTEEAEPYARIIVEMTRDRMKATIRCDTSQGARLPTFDMVMAALNEAGVVYGIDENAIENGIKSLTPFVAAVGLEPIAGENAYIDRKFN